MRRDASNFLKQKMDAGEFHYTHKQLSNLILAGTSFGVSISSGNISWLLCSRNLCSSSQPSPALSSLWLAVSSTTDIDTDSRSSSSSALRAVANKSGQSPNAAMFGVERRHAQSAEQSPRKRSHLPVIPRLRGVQVPHPFHSRRFHQRCRHWNLSSLHPRPRSKRPDTPRCLSALSLLFCASR